MSLETFLEEIVRKVVREELAALKEGRLPGDDHLLKAKEAAKLLQCSDSFLFYKKDLPFRIVLSDGPRKQMTRFSYNGIQKYLERKTRLVR